MLDIDRPLPGGVRTSTPAAGWLSPALHLSFGVCLLMLASTETSPGDDRVPPSQRTALAFVRMGNGTSGGGRFADGHPGPSPRARRAGELAAPVPPAEQRSWDARPTPDAPSSQSGVPVIPQASGLTDVPGSITSVSPVVTTGGGPGNVRGSGRTDGSGLGDVGSGYPGGGGPGPGGNLEPPTLVHQVRPGYTTAAMQARVRGIVVMEAVVERDGSVGAVKIVRSLDPTFGLDQEAVRTIRQWRFRPGRRGGTPVAMVVTIELAFELR